MFRIVFPIYIFDDFPFYLGSGSSNQQLYMRQSPVPQSKYADLLAVIEELGKDIKPTYAGSRSATERLKRGNKIVLT